MGTIIRLSVKVTGLIPKETSLNSLTEHDLLP
jgi:hypothetical protein